MKRLVKTAKQQFEEGYTSYMYDGKDYIIRLVEWGNYTKLLYKKGEVYKMKYFNVPLRQILDDDIFAESIIYLWIKQGSKHIASILHWFASAERDLNNAPFNLDDMWNCDYNFEMEEQDIEDIYEDVPDKTIVKAEQQWDEESKGLYQFYLGDGAYRIKKDDGVFTLYIAIDEIFEKRLYPSFDELRKDASFVVKYIDYVQKSHPDDMEYALEWLNGGEYTMSEVSLLDIYDIIEPLKSFIFEDKEEDPIEEMLKLTEKQKEAVGMIEEGVRMLYSNGGKIFQYYDDDLYYAVNGEGLVFQSTNYEDEKLKDKGYLDVSDVIGKQRLNFYNSDWAVDGRMYAKKSN